MITSIQAHKVTYPAPGGGVGVAIAVMVDLEERNTQFLIIGRGGGPAKWYMRAEVTFVRLATAGDYA